MDINTENENTLLRNRHWVEEDSPWKAEKIFQILENNAVNPKSICEIGCGEGSVLVNLAHFFNQDVKFIGYETIKEDFNICKQKEENNIQFYHADLLKVDAYYDVVMAINVFTHVRDYLGFLSRLRQKGEFKVFYIPLQITLYTVLRSRYIQKKEFMRSHLHHFNKDTALGTLKGTGYQIIDYFYVSRYLDNPILNIKDIFYNLPRKLLSSLNENLAAKILGGFWLMVLTK